MAVEVKRQSLFGENGQNSARADQPKAQVWMNVGYTVQVQNGTDDKGKPILEDRFISLPLGLPIDTMDPIDITTRNEQYGQFQAARNNLLEQLQDIAAKLAPGEEQTVNLELQLRRVSGEVATPAVDASNPFVKPELKLAS